MSDQELFLVFHVASRGKGNRACPLFELDILVEFGEVFNHINIADVIVIGEECVQASRDNAGNFVFERWTERPVAGQ